MNKKISLLIALLCTLLMFNIKTVIADEEYNANGYIDDEDSEQWRYDITDAKIENNILTIVGWATLKGWINKDGMDMQDVAQYTGKVENPSLNPSYGSPKYYLRLVNINDKNDMYAKINENSELVKKGILTYEEKGSAKHALYYNEGVSGFSVTCPLYFVVGQSCYNALANGFDNRNSELSKNNGHFHDNVDFKFEIDISDLKPDTQYQIEMAITTNDFLTKWKTINIYSSEGEIKNNDTTNFEISPTSTVKMLAINALKQNKDISSKKGHSVGEYFTPYKTYNIKGVKEDNIINDNSLTGAKYRFFQLEDPDNKEMFPTAWAYSAWIEIGGVGNITTIKKKDPCEDPEYAMKYMDICCDPNKGVKYPEACCGYESYIKSDIFKNDEDTKSICCLNEKQYSRTYAALDNQTVTYNTFMGYLGNKHYNFINKDFINSTCNDLKKDYGKSCPNGTSKIDDSISYTMDYMQVNLSNGKMSTFKETSKTVDVIINLKKEPNKTLTRDDVAYDYFTSEDFTKYINFNKNDKNNIFTKKEYSYYALGKDDFTITINSLSKLNSKQYKVSITLNIKNRLPLNEPITNSQNSGAYFLPFKLWLCDSSSKKEDEDNCSDKIYFSNNKAYCCSKDDYKRNPECDIGGENQIPEYGWNNNLKCSLQSNSLMNQKNVKVDNKGYCSIICDDKITLNKYPTLNQMKQNVLKPGAGFEYSFNVENKVTCNAYLRNDIVYADEDSLDSAVSGCNTMLEGYEYSKDKYKEKILTNQTMKVNNMEQYSYEYDMPSGPTISSDSTSTGFRYWSTCTTAMGSYPCVLEKTESINKFSATYNYLANIINQYISKKDSTNIKNNKLNEPDYVDGGHKYYPSYMDREGNVHSITESGTYTFKINFENFGLTRKNKSNDFTCQYLIANTPVIPSNCSKPPCGPVPGENDGKGSYYFRPISLTNPFPNLRNAGSNWLGTVNTNDLIDKYIYHNENGDNANNGNKVYGKDPMYEITLDSNKIKFIQDYNKGQNTNNGYLDWETMNAKKYNVYDQTSTFLDSLKNYGLTIRLKDDEREKKIGES